VDVLTTWNNKMETFQERLIFAYKRESNRRAGAGEKRLTKTELWKAAGSSSASASHWFSGANGADLDTCLKLSGVLRVNALWLFSDSSGIDEAMLIDRAAKMISFSEEAIQCAEIISRMPKGKQLDLLSFLLAS